MAPRLPDVGNTGNYPNQTRSGGNRGATVVRPRPIVTSPRPQPQVRPPATRAGARGFNNNTGRPSTVVVRPTRAGARGPSAPVNRNQPDLSAAANRDAFISSASRDPAWIAAQTRNPNSNVSRFFNAQMAQQRDQNQSAVQQAMYSMDALNRLYNVGSLDSINALNQGANLARQNNISTQADIAQQERQARQAYDLSLRGVNIGRMSNAANLGAIGQQRNLANQQYGLQMRQNQGGLANVANQDNILRQGRAMDVTDIAEQKRLSDLQNNIQMGTTSGMASGAARLGFLANTNAASSTDQRSKVSLMEGLSRNQFTRQNLNWDLESAGLSRKETELTLQQRERDMRANAAKLGLSVQQYQADLNNSMRQLGLDRIMSVSQYNDALNSRDLQVANIARSTNREIAANPQFQSAARTALGGIK